MRKLFCILLVICIENVVAQETEEKFSLNVSSDFVSNYIWRGLPTSDEEISPNIQPLLSATYKDFELGIWGSYDILGLYQETDLYFCYAISNSLLFTAIDYFWNPEKKYFNFKKEETAHVVEGMLTYNCGEKFPLEISVGTFFYGDDHKFEENINDFDYSKQNYSTYIELIYTVKVDKHDFKVLLASTPFDGMYGDGYGKTKGFNVINIGLSGSKLIKITENFELPVNSTFTINPQTESAWLVFGITL